MSLLGVSDAFLARRVAGGDEVAFAELARRYRPLIVRVTRRLPLGVEVEDERQEALIGLFEACVEHDPARGRFAGLASLRVRSKVWGARASALARKHRILTEACRDGEERTGALAERSPAARGSDPAVVVELRDELRRRAERARRRARSPGGDLRRRYTDAQVSLALALIAEGKTLKQTAAAVGAPAHTVNRWLKRAGRRRLSGRQRYTAGEIGLALSLLDDGASLRQAGAAVGASNATVLRWLRNAA